MTSSSNKISIRREAAAERQAGRCFYCGVVMCRSNPSEFATRFGLKPSQVLRLSCTAEHLTARQDGGGDSLANIAAACWQCNQSRHRRKLAPDPVAFRHQVGKRVRAGRWHQEWVFQAGLLCRGNDTASGFKEATS